MPAPMKNNNAGKGRFITDAIIKALHEEAENSKGERTKRLTIMATKLVKRACDDDVFDLGAITTIIDRVEGKSAQAVTVQGDEANPLIIQGDNDTASLARRLVAILSAHQGDDAKVIEGTVVGTDDEDTSTP